MVGQDRDTPQITPSDWIIAIERLFILLSALGCCFFLGRRFAPNKLSLPDISPTDRPAGFEDRGFSLRFYLSVLTMFRNEAPYLAEWIEYNLLVGIEHFWLVNNDSEDNPNEVLTPYIDSGIVNLTNWTGRAQQIPVYHMMGERVKGETFWLAVIDVDEFFVPLTSRSVVRVFRELECFPGITVNWVVYGSNKQLRKGPGLVMERFRNHTHWTNMLNHATKGVVNPRRVRGYSVHDHFYEGKWRSRDVRGHRNAVNCLRRPPVHRLLRINHYYCKSREEFQAKIARGSSAGVFPDGLAGAALQKIVNQGIAQLPDVITNDRAIDWAIPLVKENLGNRSLPAVGRRFHVHTWPWLFVRHICWRG
jgi:hypothetical protein